MDLLNKKMLKDAVSSYQSALKDYDRCNKLFQDEAVRLYNERKKTLEIVQKFQEYILSLHDLELKIMMEDSESIESFVEIKNREEAGEVCTSLDLKEVSNTIGIASGAAGVVGTATALGGQAALWAIASSVGYTAGGTAISSLVGIAEANAFLAWLGGGALAAGGGGVAAGSAIFAAVPIVGWAVAAIGTSVMVFKMSSNSKKNKENALQALSAAEKLSQANEKLRQYADKASSLIEKIEENRLRLKYLTPLSDLTSPEPLASQKRSTIEDGIVCYKMLCHYINESVVS